MSAVLICPTRLIEKRKIFTDCLHLLTSHEPGNDLHIVSEVSVPGGSVDYFLISVADGKVKDFVGIELQTLDTTGTVWPERQRFMRKIGDAMHFHAYSFSKNSNGLYKLALSSRLSTDESGVAKCLGFQVETRVGLEKITSTLEKKISEATLFSPT